VQIAPPEYAQQIAAAREALRRLNARTREHTTLREIAESAETTLKVLLRDLRVLRG
jgi:hypothetical protein